MVVDLKFATTREHSFDSFGSTRCKFIEGVLTTYRSDSLNLQLRRQSANPFCRTSSVFAADVVMVQHVQERGRRRSAIIVRVCSAFSAEAWLSQLQPYLT